MSLFAQFTDFTILGPSEVIANSKSVASSKKIVPGDKEQRNANKQGTLGKVAGAVSDIASKLTAIPVVGSIASTVAPIASMVGGIFDYFGWDKPTNISSQVFTTNRPNRGLQHGSGQDLSEVVALKPDQKVSTEAKLFGFEDVATRSFVKLLQTPLWIGSFTIPNNQVVGSVFKKFWVRPYAPNYITTGEPATLEIQSHDYMSYYSQFFTSCRGGYKYLIHFDTSSYTTTRLRITFEPSRSTIMSITDGGDSFSRIIDINGATTVVFEVPYCYPSLRMPIGYTVTDNQPANGQLLLSLVNPIQTNGSSTDVVFANVFRCAADDFRFYQPHKFDITRLTPLSEEDILPNSLSQIMSSQTVTTLGDGPKVLFERMTEDEEILTHNDFLHRYHVAQPYVESACRLYPTAGDAYYWLTPFRAYRGSTRHRPGVYWELDGIIVNSDSDTDAVISAGAYLTNQCVPIEVPYNSNIRFLPIINSENIWSDGYERLLRTTSAADQAHMWAAGDDFTLGLRTTPRPISIAL
jgi:hypothetical protein